MLLTEIDFSDTRQASNTSARQPASRLDQQMAVANLDHSISGHLLEHRPGFGEVLPELDIVVTLDLREAQLEIADQRLDDGAADMVVLIAAQASGGGKLMLIQLILILRDIAGVLAVEITDLTDGRNTETDQIAMSMGGVALEVALQAAVLLRHRQLIVG